MLMSKHWDEKIKRIFPKVQIANAKFDFEIFFKVIPNLEND
jgi:hypothetical protein